MYFPFPFRWDKPHYVGKGLLKLLMVLLREKRKQNNMFAVLLVKVMARELPLMKMWRMN
jgi:hypothetical protein